MRSAQHTTLLMWKNLRFAELRRSPYTVSGFDVRLYCEVHLYSDVWQPTGRLKCPKCVRGVMDLPTKRENAGRLECRSCLYVGDGEEIYSGQPG